MAGVELDELEGPFRAQPFRGSKCPPRVYLGIEGRSQNLALAGRGEAGGVLQRFLLGASSSRRATWSLTQPG